MLHFFKFRQDLFDPAPARDVYERRAPGRGWPEECPPVRAANGFGFDVLANFDLTLVQGRDGWTCRDPLEVESDWAWVGRPGPDGGEAPERRLTQAYAWGWERGQTLPHPIDDHVFERVKHQVKVSTFLYLKTDENEVLLLTGVPNREPRPWRAVSALIETDWYPASYPWHCVLELDPRAKRIEIPRGEPLCRLIPLRRDTYFAGAMSPDEFDRFFARGQDWLATHGRVPELAPTAAAGKKGKGKGKGKGKAEEVEPGLRDITRTYGRQQVRSRFVVLE